MGRAYDYKVKGLYEVSAEIMGKVMEELEDSEEGLTPSTLVEASRPEDAPLHNEFEWRDDVAAEKYRRTQAQGMIRNIVIIQQSVTEEERKEMDRAFASIPGGTGQYVALETALGHEAWKNHLLKQAKDEMISFIAKYRRLTELAGVVDEMNRVLQGK